MVLGLYCLGKHCCPGTVIEEEEEGGEEEEGEEEEEEEEEDYKLWPANKSDSTWQSLSNLA